MNCTIDDIAIVIGKSKYAGLLVHVINKAPEHIFKLPNGVAHRAARPGSWVVKSLGKPFEDALGDGLFGVGNDERLLPIPIDRPAKHALIDYIENPQGN